MRLERLNPDKIRIFLTFDDLVERGISKEDMWQDIPKVHELFNDMMDQAYQELDFEVSGPVAVEVFNLPAQGMVVIVTRGKGSFDSSEDDHEEHDDFYELEVTLDESDDVLFCFKELEDVIQLAHKLNSFLQEEGKLYQYNDRYFLLFEDLILDDSEYELTIALLSEFAEPSTLSKYILDEYGHKIIENNAIQVLCQHFKL